MEYRLTTSTTWTSVSVATASALIQNLTSGRSYVFRVQARNLAGVGAFSRQQTLGIA